MSGPRTLELRELRLAAGPVDRPRILVDGVNLSLRRDSVHAVVGGSGGGKTLSCLAVLGLLPPGVRRVGGDVLLDGRALSDGEIAGLRGRTVALIQQAPRSAFNPIVSIGRHVRETLAVAGVTGAAAGRRSRELLAEVGLPEPARVQELFPFQLSGGMLQRAMIALALAQEPAFLIADEPTTDLDLVLQAQILALLERLRRERGLGVLLVTHDLSVVARLAGEVSVLERGRVVEAGPVGELFDRPAHPATRALLATHLALYGQSAA